MGNNEPRPAHAVARRDRGASNRTEGRPVSCVYIALAEGREGLKVGHSSNLNARRKTLAFSLGTSVSFQFTMPVDDAPAVEAMAHWILRDSQTQGEWFSATVTDARAAIEQACALVAAGDVAPRRITGATRFADQVKDESVSLSLSAEELEALDAWRADHKVWSRSEAIRQLIASGIK